MQMEQLLQMVKPEMRGKVAELYRRRSNNGQAPNPSRLLPHLRSRGLLLEDEASPASVIELTAYQERTRCMPSPAPRPQTAETTPRAEDQEKPSDIELTVFRNRTRLLPPRRPAGAASSGRAAAAVENELTENGNALDFLRHSDARFDMVGNLGTGAMGEVKLARDRLLLRKIAYKSLLRDSADNPEIVMRFLTEAQVTAQLDHPNIVPVYSLEGEDPQDLAYTMKLIQGRTLGDMLGKCRELAAAGKPLPPQLSRDTLVDHFLKVCDAIAFAHDKGVLHRDLKPSNVMIGQFNEVYVVDWGIARVMQLPDLPGGRSPQTDRAATWDGGTQTMEGTLLGTPRYMSPEQARGEIEHLDARSDLYSLGLILYEIICLQPAYTAPDLDTLMEKVSRGAREPVRAVHREHPVGREWKAIIDKATAADAAHRYPSVAELQLDLRRLRRGEATSALPDNLLRRSARWVGRHRVHTLVILLASVLLGALGTTWSQYRHAMAQEQAQLRENMMTRAFSAFTVQSHRITEHFQFYDELLEGLAVAARQRLLITEPTPDLPLYTPGDFAHPQRAPADLARIPGYGDLRISTEFPVAVAADAQAAASLGRLAGLDSEFKRLFQLAHQDVNPLVSAAAVRVHLRESDNALAWAYIGLENGAALFYPGSGGFPEDFDARRRPWYSHAVSHPGKSCGHPYRDLSGQGVYLPCVTPLYDDSGTLLGVAGLDLTLDYAVRRLLPTPSLPDSDGYLLDDEGRILVGSATDTTQDTDDFPRFPDAQVVAALRQGQTGHKASMIEGRPVWIFYASLGERGWGYVTVVDPSGMARSPAG